MNDSSARPEPLDFEKPIAEIENELHQMRDKAQSGNMNLSEEISAL